MRAALLQRVEPRWWMLLPLVLALAATVGCEGDSGSPTSPASGPFRLTFSLNATFQGLHGGHPIAIAIVRSSDGSVVARANGAVSATDNPSFLWSTGPMMQAGTDYEVHYWIDSNFGGGTFGACDPKAIDHQWSVELRSVSNDINLVMSHNEALTEDVCSTFS